MSNARRPKWTEAQIDASNAEALLAGLASDLTAAATRRVITGHLLADAGAAGVEVEPGLVAAVEQAAMGLGDEFWLERYRELTAGGTAG